HPHRPQALHLPAGQGSNLQQDMRRLVDEMFTVLPTAFESESYHRQKKAIEEEFRDRQEQAVEEIRKEAREHNIALLPTPNGLAFAPLINDEVISPEQVMKLPEAEQKAIESAVKRHQDALQMVVHQMPQWKRETQNK